MNNPNKILSALLLVAAAACPTSADAQTQERKPANHLQAALLSATEVDADRLRSLANTGHNAVVIELRGDTDASRERERAAAESVKKSQLDLFYWIEIARNPALADAHPKWMASLQGHQQWRRLFKDVPDPEDNEVVKVYPWVPVLYKEAFEAHLERVERLLKDNPEPKGVFLNDLQGAPSACGCGNPLCRWTTDYGPIRTATRLGPDAAARFVAAVEKLVPESQVVPVWVTECEEHDGAKDGLCAGVGCFKGACWKAFTAQLMPVAGESDRLGVLLPFRAFQRDLPIYGAKAGWIGQGISSFQKMPPRHNGKAIGASRLLPVLQGWDVSKEEIAAQIRMAEESGAAGYVVSYLKIDQGWQPRIIKWK